MPNTLLDQVPVLANLKRYLEELTIMQVPDDPSLVRRGTGVEQIPEVLQSIKDNVNFKEIAQWQKHQIFNETAEMKREIAKSLVNMYNFDDMDTLLEEPKCSQCGTMATQRCSRCKNEWYCGYVLCVLRYINWAALMKWIQPSLSSQELEVSQSHMRHFGSSAK